MDENQIIVVVGSDLFRAGMILGLGISIGVCFAIGAYGIASKALDLMAKGLSKVIAR